MSRTEDSGHKTDDLLTGRLNASNDWPPDVLALFGSWKDDDFPDAAELRKAYGLDVPRETSNAPCK